MSLPSRALLLIHAYSRPITCANWRKSKPVITPFGLYAIIKKAKKIQTYIFNDTP